MKPCINRVARSLVITCFLVAASLLVLGRFEYSFSYSANTLASKEEIWELWVDVENWKQFDERLEYSFIENNQQFADGATGYLKGRNAPRTKLRIEQVNSDKSFSVRLLLPLSQSIEMQRYFEETETGTQFTHKVIFHGWLKPLFFLALAAPFKSDLHLVVDSIQTIADERASAS